MNIKIKLIIILKIITALALSSCGVIKEGFSSQKKNNSDEFLVEKKSPLMMPPDYDKLPTPENFEEDSDLKKSNEIKKLITNSENISENSENSQKSKKSFEELLLGKIKNN